MSMCLFYIKNTTTRAYVLRYSREGHWTSPFSCLSLLVLGSVRESKPSINWIKYPSLLPSQCSMKQWGPWAWHTVPVYFEGVSQNSRYIHDQTSVPQTPKAGLEMHLPVPIIFLMKFSGSLLICISKNVKLLCHLVFVCRFYHF